MRKISLNDFKPGLYTGAMYTAPRSENIIKLNSDTLRYNIPYYPELILQTILTKINFFFKLDKTFFKR